MKKTVVLTIILLLCHLNLFSAGEDEYENGFGYYQQEKFLLSIGAFKQAVAKGYDDPVVYFYLGNAYLSSENYTKAIEYFDTAYDEALDFDLQSMSLFNMGAAYHMTQDFTNAIRYYDMAYELNDELTRSFWFKGIAYFNLKDEENLVNEWETYLDLEPDGDQSENIRAILALLEDENFDLEQLFNPSADSNSDNPDTGNETDNDRYGQLIDISGVLDNIEPEDRGIDEDLEMEDLEM